jgi:hypothetical protein
MGSRAFIFYLMLVTSGCTSTSGVKWWSPKTYLSGSEARSEVKAKASVDDKREAVLRAGQRSLYEVLLALAVAAPSRAIDLATDAAQSAQALFDQALGALPVDETTRLRARVAALLSDNEAIRTNAEKERTAARSLAAEQGKELQEARTRLADAQAALSAAFARENAVANAYRNEKMVSLFWKIGLGTIAVLGVAGWVYVRFVAGGWTGMVGRALARADNDRPEAARIARSVLDDVMDFKQQAKIKKTVEAIKAKAP